MILPMFHLSGEHTIEVSAKELGLETFVGKQLTELWTKESIKEKEERKRERLAIFWASFQLVPNPP